MQCMEERMSVVELLKVIVQGIVEGFTEWLPISSTGHMLLVDEIIQMDQPEAFLNVFFVVIQLGAILAVVLLYYERLNPFSLTSVPHAMGWFSASAWSMTAIISSSGRL